jgi:PAS domain S-box-containing protein
LAWFIAFMLLTAGLIIPASLIYHAREKKATQVALTVQHLQIEFLKDNKSVNDFITIVPQNQDFFIKGESPFLSSHRQSYKQLTGMLHTLRDSRQSENLGITGQIEALSEGLNDYYILFDSLVYLVYKKGSNHFGLEGELSDYAQELDNTRGLSKSDVYRLREIESNYFQKTDTASKTALNVFLIELTGRISQSTSLSRDEKTTISQLVANYAAAFYRLIEIDRQTGISRNLALRASLNAKSDSIIQHFEALSNTAAAAQEAYMKRLNLFYILSILLIISLAVVFSYKTSKHVVSHLETLTNYISTLSKSKLDDSHSIDLHNSAREIKQIYHEFRNLISQLKIWEKQRDSALQNADDNQQNYRELTDMLPQSVFETDSYGNYTYVNKAWHQSFGFTEGDLKEGLNLIETLVSEAKDSDILGIQKIENSSFIAVRKNGTRFPASVYTDNIIRKGKIAGRRGIIIDITERVNYIRSLQLETTRAKTSDELKSSFLANMSHEIRTPMNSIIGFSNLLASDQVPEIQKKSFTQYIRTSSEILLNLVDDIIDIAKIEAGELKIVKKDCALNALGTELLTTSLETRSRFNKQHILLEFKADVAKPEVYVKTDPFRLRQVLVNLINNALKFTDKGSVEFGYNVIEDSTIEFYVKDTGPGLSREELDMIFERFKRSKRSEEKNIVGTGLGLAIAKNLVQLLGGEMWVDSTAGVGTTFLFTLPYLRSTVIPERDKNHQAPAEYNWKGRTILIVEDDIHSFKYLNEVLRKTQATIVHASNGHKAVEMVNITPIDLVVMDIQLPGMDGLEATKIIKDIRPELPVIAQTAFAMSGDREKMKLAGCDDYVAKPLNTNQILGSIHHLLTNGVRKTQSRQNSVQPRIITG